MFSHYFGEPLNLTISYPNGSTLSYVRPGYSSHIKNVGMKPTSEIIRILRELDINVENYFKAVEL